MDEIWKKALDVIQAGQEAVLVMVVDHRGSVPGKTGARMVVTEKETFGTVGGGAVERDVIAAAREGGPPRLIEVAHDGGSSASACSGRQVFALVPLDRRHEETLRAVARSIEAAIFGVFTATRHSLSFEPGGTPARALSGDGDEWSYRETVGYSRTLTIVGGGHVSLALCRVMSELPFALRVLDDRPELDTLRDNPYAHERRTVSYDDIASHVPTGERSYVAIMTHGHRFDEAVLEQLAPLPFAYLGMMGSAAKVAGIFERLGSRGIPRRDLDRVHAPIGLPIGSRTPPEIALSIAAEIVAVKNGL